MNKKKIIYAGITVLFGMMILVPMVSSDIQDFSKTITDPSGDVKDNDVDITLVSSEKLADEVKFEMTVSGNIRDTSPEDSPFYMYQIYIGNNKNIADDNTETLCVQFVGDSTATFVNALDYLASGEANYTIEGSKITMFVPVSAFEEFSNYYMVATASAVTYDEQGTMVGLPIVDNAFSWNVNEEDSSSYETEDTDDSGGEISGSPGFEILLFIMALSLILYVYVRRKK